MDNFKTECCPPFDPKPWHKKTFVFKNKLFVKANTINFMHIPLNMGKIMKTTWPKIEKAKAVPKALLLLSYDPSPWKAEHYFAVTKKVPGCNMTKLSGTFVTLVFEGPFKNAPQWVKQTEDYLKSKNKKIKKLYFFYTTCPKCIKVYHKNYVVAFAQT